MPPMGPMGPMGGMGPGPVTGQGPGQDAVDEGYFMRLSNVHYQLNVRELLRFLRAVRVHEGGVRMVEERGAPTLPSGRRRRTGIAYVHVPSWEDLQSALELDGMPLRDRQIGVAQCPADEYYNEGVCVSSSPLLSLAFCSLPAAHCFSSLPPACSVGQRTAARPPASCAGPACARTARWPTRRPTLRPD